MKKTVALFLHHPTCSTDSVNGVIAALSPMANIKLFTRHKVNEGFFDDVAKNWNKEIDILHIDGDHTYESVKNDYETWSPFVKENGVILFHDTCIDTPRFGVKRFFEELDMPKLTFTHTCGLGVASKNKQLIEFIKSNFNLDNPL